jgi:putative Ca2+/H+ antiporter (TMEM165/GDT1 family)
MVCGRWIPQYVSAFLCLVTVAHAVQSLHVKLDLSHIDTVAGSSRTSSVNRMQATEQQQDLHGMPQVAKSQSQVKHLANESSTVEGWMTILLQKRVSFDGYSVALMSKAWMAALSQSFFVVGVAELFDKTWFVALIYAISLGRTVAFIGSYVALLLHTAIAAALGLGFSQLFKVSTLHFITTTVFAIFAVLYTFEWFRADPEADALAERADEARDELGEDDVVVLSKTSGKRSEALSNMLAWQCFVAVFIAEWGDRTQIAMITLHASLPLLPVIIGSAAAFFLLTLSAVIVATLLDGMKLSERVVLGMSASSFVVFALLAFRDGWVARSEEVNLMH